MSTDVLSVRRCGAGFVVGAACLLLAQTGRVNAQPTVTVMVEMRDTVRLATDVYLPQIGAGPWPVVLIRTPYDKGGMEGVCNGLRDNGVAAVAQDTRGKFGSEGTDCVFLCDGDGALKDGLDTMNWITSQTWCDGHVGTHGGSALGIVQYMLATTTPSGLSAMWAVVATPSLFDHGFYQGLVFRQAMIEGWLQAQGSSFFLDDLAAHPTCDSFWDSVQTEDQYGLVDVPTVHVGGWYDIFNQGTLDAFVGYQHGGAAGAVGKQKLIMGPWTHSVGDVHAGELTYPANAADTPDGMGNLLVLWLLHYLGMAPDQAAVDAVPAVQYYVMGDAGDPNAPGNRWRTANDWPVPAAPIRMHLQPQGGLSESCPPAGGGSSGYVYDPADPSPTVGGANLILPAGPRDQVAVESRSDVLVFSSDILTQPMEITGRVKAHMFVSIDTPDSDLMVRMTDVYPDGRSMLVLDGALRLASRGTNTSLTPLSPGEIVEAVVDLWSTSIILNSGHRLRVIVSSSNAPRFWPNPNDGSSYGGVSTPTQANVTVHHDLARASFIEVPDPGRDVSQVTVCSGQQPDGGVQDGAVGDGGSGRDGDVTADGGGTPGGPGSSGCNCRIVARAGSHRAGGSGPSRSGEVPLTLLVCVLVAGLVRSGARKG